MGTTARRNEGRRDMVIPQFSGILRERQMGRLRFVLIFAFLGLTAWWSARAFQAEHPLTGRRIAPVMSAGGADWLDRSEREAEENPNGALDAIGVRPGMTVADV